MRYRVNYGNGQVSGTFTSKREALAELARAHKDDGFAFLQFYEPGSADAPGDWFSTK